MACELSASPLAGARKLGAEGSKLIRLRGLSRAEYIRLEFVWEFISAD